MKEQLKKELLERIQESDKEWTTLELSDFIQRSRSVTSLYLNELAREGKIQKSDTRPVYWTMTQTNQSVELTQDVFRQFIGARLSFTKVIEDIKDALNYPPRGLPILIHGNSGVGKSYLAHLISEYLQDANLPCAERLIVFNCADYANNPELLSSVLFGHVKGAFTGAKSDKVGILEQAHHGILFLDEVHRLSLENQEKLFQFLDKGYFRRLGDDETVIYSQSRLLLATTEDPNEVLLPTFYRRIPLTVHLSDFHLRPRTERIQLTAYLFQKEGQRIGRELMIESDLLEQLINRKYQGNVGSLSNEIKVLCAQAYRRQLKDKTTLYITLNRQHTNVQWLYINQLVHSNQSPQGLVNQREALIEYNNLPQLRGAVHELLDQASEEVSDDYLYGLYGPRVDKIKQKLFTVLPCTKSSTDFKEEFWHHLMTLWYVAGQTDSSHYLVYRQLMETYPRACSLAYQLAQEETSKAVLVPLMLMLSDRVSEQIQYQALLVAHGDSTASSIQSVANELLGHYVFDAINVPLTSSPEDIIVEVKQWLNERDTTNGVMMLVDMGSLTQLYQGLKPQIKGELLVVNNLTTSYALEIGQKMIQKEPFHSLIESIQINFKTEIQYFEGFDHQTNVIVSSISGPEITESIANILRKYVQTDVKVVEIEYTELIDLLNQKQEDHVYFASTVAIVTTTPLTTPASVNVINLMDLLTDETNPGFIESFEPFISLSAKQSLLDHLLYLFSREGLTDKLEFLNPDVIIAQVERVLSRFEQRFQYTFNVQIKFILSMHLAVLIERVMLGAQDYEVPVDLHQLKINNKLFFPNAKSILFELEQFYRIEISDWEIYVIYEIISASDEELAREK
ncbi:sigma 54-interacting transcriptional regulator [Dolosicoccus paucivorans]|nr:sigma 54-interacting transcriptional regulator [Dolosicoccus paucivorans]